MRNILDNTSRESVPLEQEISTIGNYLELQKIRYQGRFDYQITVDENIDPEATFIPPMLAQPFIENAIEHGIKHLKEQGMIMVRFNLYGPEYIRHSPSPEMGEGRGGGMIVLEITDNGIGRPESARIEQPHSKDHRPMATAITRERLRVLCRRAPRSLRQHIGLEVEDLMDSQGNPCGTRVRLVVPVG